MEDTTSPQAHSVENPARTTAAQEDSAAGQMKRAVAEFLSARIELAGIEAREAAGFTARKVAYAVVLAMCGFFVWVLVLAGLSGLLSDWTQKQLADSLPGVPGWVMVVFGLAVIHALIAVVFLFLLKRKPATPLFELTRKEIENDKAWAKNKR